MKTNLLKSIFISLILLVGATNAWAYDQSAVDLYFDNSEAKWTNCYVYIGHGSYTSCYAMSRVSGTQYLWKLPSNFNGGNKWDGATGWVVCKEKWWDSQSESIDKYTWHGAKNVTKKSTSAWSDANIYKTNGTTSVTSDGNTINAYAVTSYTKNNYTVTIKTATGGTLTVKDYDNNTVSNGASKIHLTVLKFSATASTGYTFSQVQINNGGTTTTISAADIASKTYTLTSNVTITPIWTPNTYNITYKDQGNVTFSGTHASGHPTTHTYGTATTLKSPTKNNYTFGGWFTSSNCSGSAISSLSATGYTADITLYAKWTINTHTVDYGVCSTTRWGSIKLNSETAITTTGTKTLNYGTAISFTATPNTGYQVEGWYSDSDCTSKITAAGTSTPYDAGTLTADKTVYVKFEAIPANSHNISYTPQGTGWTYGNSNPTTAEEGAKVTFVVTPTAGYSVSVSSDGPALTGPNASNEYTFTMPNKDVEITVDAKPEQYTVTLDNQGATTAGTTSVKATYNAALPSITAPAKTGYTFGGYYTATNGGGTQYYKADGTSAKAWTETSVTKLYAKWTANKYTVKFNENGGTGTMSEQSFTYDESKPLTTNAFTRKGYDFAGWATSSNGTVQYTDGQSVSNLTATNNSTVNLYAVWNEQEPITVYFRPKTAWKDNSPVIICDDNPTAVTPYDCSGDYYTAQVPATTEDLKFGGNGEQTLSLTVPTDDKVLYDMTSKTITKLYLKANSYWKADGARFAAYFFGNGEKWVSMTAVAGQTDLYEVTIPTDKSYPSVIFCRMNGGNQTNGWSNKWNQTADLTIPTDGTNRADLPTNVNDGANVTWHTEWDDSRWKEFTVPTYSITKTVGTGGTVTVSKESGITLNEQVTVTVTASNGYTYKSGTITIGTNAATNLAAGTSTHTICGNTKISVDWNANKYSVKFDANDGEGEMANQDFTYDAAAQALTANTFTRTGYTFAGWNTQADGKGTSYTDKQSVLNLTTENNGVVTLYAQWTPNTYTVKFDKNDGEATGTMADQSFTYDKAQQLTANVFERTNWKFAGWNTQADGKGTSYSDQQSVSNLTTTNNGVVNLYAQWAPAQDAYTITIRANGNGTVSPESVIVNKSITAEVTATPNEGYKFIGWKTEGGAEVADKGSVSTANASSTTVTASAAGSVTANFESVLPNTLTLTQQPMYKERPNPIDGVPGCDGTEANPYKIYSEEFVRITAAALPEVEGLTAYYKFGDKEQVENVFDFSEISGTTPSKITVKAYYKKDATVWGSELTTDSYYFLRIPLPYYVSTSPATEMSLDRVAAGEDITVQFRSDDKTTVNLYVQTGDDVSTKNHLVRIENSASYDYHYVVPDNINPCVLRFIAESEGLHNGRSFSKYAEVALYKNVVVKVNDPNSLLRKVYMWRGEDIKSEWPGEDFAQTFGTWRVFTVKYPYYDHFILNDGTNTNQTFDYEVPSEDKCYQLSENKVTQGGYTNYKLTETTCPGDLLVGDINDITIAEGEQTVVMPEIFVGLGYQLSDVEVEISNSNTNSVSAMRSGTNIVVLGTSEGSSNVTVSYTLGDERIEKTFKVTVEKKNVITIQVKVPIGNSDNYNTIGWNDNSLIKIHYWWSTGKNADIPLRYVYEEANKYKHLQAEVPLDANGKTNFIIGYDNFDENWEKTANITNVTTDGCYTLKNGGWEASPTATREGNECWDENDYPEYQVKILMQNGKTYLSNMTNSKESILSFFAPGKNTTGRNAGVVMLYNNGKLAGLIDPSMFEESTVYVAQVNDEGYGLTNVAPYTGNYYIRTWGANNDISNKGIQSVSTWTPAEKTSRSMTFFISRVGEYYNHYWVQAMEPVGTGKDVSAWVANDYNDDLAGKLTGDKNTDDSGMITNLDEGKKISVRFGYDPRTNYFGRAVLRGSGQYEDYLNLHCDNAYSDAACTTKLPYGTSNTTNKFRDISNWVYEREVYVKITNSNPSASMYIEAKSPRNDIEVKNHLLGYVINEATGAETATPIQKTIIGSGADNGVYKMRVVYDFKTNRMIAAWEPNDIEVSTTKTLNADVMFMRKENNAVPQITLIGDGRINSIKSIFFALELQRGDAEKANRHEEQYMFTLPFDCVVGSISGVPGYMEVWGIQRYRGDLRAQKGWFIETPTFWEWMSLTDTLKAGEGYLLAFDKKNAHWEEFVEEDQKTKTSLLRLYFPSIQNGFDLQPQSAEQLTRTYENHTCTITRDDRHLQDSNWKMIGTTSYNNAKVDGYVEDTDPEYEELNGNTPPNFRYTYSYVFDSNNNRTSYEYNPEDGKTATYQSFYGYMVQFAGTITWSPMNETVPEKIAARRNAEYKERTSVTTRLELANAEGEKQDQTFVALDEKATTTFDQNKDLNKVFNSGKANIYTLSEGIPFAGNTLPMEEIVVPVGIRITNAGEYTFRMPDGTEGMVVELIDYEANITTNLLLDDYTVNLPAGSNETRFALSLKPEKTATSIESTTTPSDSNIRKFIIDGKLYLQKDGMLYDAQGKLVR